MFLPFLSAEFPQSHRLDFSHSASMSKGETSTLKQFGAQFWGVLKWYISFDSTACKKHSTSNCWCPQELIYIKCLQWSLRKQACLKKNRFFLLQIRLANFFVCGTMLLFDLWLLKLLCERLIVGWCQYCICRVIVSVQKWRRACHFHPKWCFLRNHQELVRFK